MFFGMRKGSGEAGGFFLSASLSFLKKPLFIFPLFLINRGNVKVSNYFAKIPLLSRNYGL